LAPGGGGEWSTACTGCFTFVKVFWYPLNERLGGPQSQPRHLEEKKNLLLLLGFEPQILLPVAQSVYRPHYSGSLVNVMFRFSRDGKGRPVHDQS